MDSIEERNSDFEYVDSWFERIEEFVNNTTLELIPTQAIHELLDLASASGESFLLHSDKTNYGQMWLEI